MNETIGVESIKILLSFICNIITFIYIRHIVEAEVGCDYFVCD